MKSTINLMLTSILRIKNILQPAVLKKELSLLEDTDVRLDEELFKKGLITEDQRAIILADCFNYVSKDIDILGYDEKIVKMVTSAFVTKHEAIPLFATGTSSSKIDKSNETNYTIAITDPFNYRIINIFKTIFGDNITFIVSTPSRVKKLQSLVFTKAQVSDAITEYYSSEEKITEKIDNIEGADVLSAPAVKLAESILREGIAASASDIHIEPFQSSVRVRYRIDGVLYESTNFDIRLYPALSTRFKILAGMNIAERRIPQDGRIKQEVAGANYDFRVSTLPTVYGEKLVIRILDTTAFSFTRDKLTFLDSENVLIDELLAKPYGIILLTGPTGCGKSTTLYSFIKELNSSDTNVITVEDPVEYTMEGVNQVQVNPKANMTFASALRSILRQDPNVIMIGEIRDEETAEIAIRSAITGHLVLSTLHTNDAAGAITRLIDMNVEPYLVSDALVGVIAQRLVRRLCSNCKKEGITTTAENKILNISNSTTIYRPVGCPACGNTGYKGRFAVHEVLVLNQKLKEMILDKHSTEDIKLTAIKNGMIELKDTCKEMVLRGETSVLEMAALIYSKKDDVNY